MTKEHIAYMKVYRRINRKKIWKQRQQNNKDKWRIK